MKRKSYYAAEKYFNDAIKIDKNNGDAWFYLAENYLKAGNFKKSLDAYKTARVLTSRTYEIRDRIKELEIKLKKGPRLKTSFIKKMFGSKKE